MRAKEGVRGSGPREEPLSTPGVCGTDGGDKGASGGTSWPEGVDARSMADTSAENTVCFD